MIFYAESPCKPKAELKQLLIKNSQRAGWCSTSGCTLGTPVSHSRRQFVRTHYALATVQQLKSRDAGSENAVGFEGLKPKSLLLLGLAWALWNPVRVSSDGSRTRRWLWSGRSRVRLRWRTPAAGRMMWKALQSRSRTPRNTPWSWLGVKVGVT